VRRVARTLADMNGAEIVVNTEWVEAAFGMRVAITPTIERH